MKKNTHNINTVKAKSVKPIKVALLKGAEAINDMIDSISSRGKVLENDIHITATSILAHTEEHGDITLANRLINAIPNLARKNALRDWFQSFGKFAYDTTSQVLTYDKNKSTNVELARTTPFWEFKPEAAYTPFNLEAALANLIKKAEKHMQDANPLDAIDINKLTALKLVFDTPITKDVLAA